MEVSTKRFRKREAILACLRSTTTHPGAEWVYAQLKPQIPDLSLGTVYRNLALFKEQGLIQSVGHVGGVERFDGFTHPHVHFICENCASVIDLMELEIPESLSREAGKASGGRVNACNLTFYGTCENCLV
ncbi:MAG: transcriptional repressor [Faecousia sp.]